MEHYEILALWKRGAYTVYCTENAHTPEDSIFQMWKNDGVFLNAAATFGKESILWEMNGYGLRAVVLPLLCLCEQEDIRHVPLALSDTRISFLLPDKPSLEKSLRQFCEVRIT